MLLGRLVHRRDRHVDAAGRPGQRVRRVVARLQDQRLEQQRDRVLAARDEADPAALDVLVLGGAHDHPGRVQQRQQGEQGQRLQRARRVVAAVRVAGGEHRRRCRRRPPASRRRSSPAGSGGAPSATTTPRVSSSSPPTVLPSGRVTLRRAARDRARSVSGADGSTVGRDGRGRRGRRRPAAPASAASSGGRQPRARSPSPHAAER